MTTYNAAVEVLTDKSVKREMQSKIRKLNDRKDNLEERMGKSGTGSVLENDLDLVFLDKQIAELDVFIDAITTRRGEL